MSANANLDECRDDDNVYWIWVQGWPLEWLLIWTLRMSDEHEYRIWLETWLQGWLLEWLRIWLQGWSLEWLRIWLETWLSDMNANMIIEMLIGMIAGDIHWTWSRTLLLVMGDRHDYGYDREHYCWWWEIDMITDMIENIIDYMCIGYDCPKSV